MLLKGKRIFYIEDNLANRALVQLVLEQQGANMHFDRWGGSDALNRLRMFQPVDLILLDLMLPDNLTGYSIFETIRQHLEFSSIPIAAVSAADPALAMTKTRALGFAGFISKPINILTFPQQIEALAAGKQIWFAN